MATTRVAKSNSKESALVVAMHQTKQTKGTYVYGADEDDSPITTLYIRKEGFPEGAPENITVTVSV